MGPRIRKAVMQGNPLQPMHRTTSSPSTTSSSSSSPSMTSSSSSCKPPGFWITDWSLQWKELLWERLGQKGQRPEIQNTYPAPSTRVVFIEIWSSWQWGHHIVINAMFHLLSPQTTLGWWRRHNARAVGVRWVLIFIFLALSSFFVLLINREADQGWGAQCPTASLCLGTRMPPPPTWTG